jgi:hypothetical protein
MYHFGKAHRHNNKSQLNPTRHVMTYFFNYYILSTSNYWSCFVQSDSLTGGPELIFTYLETMYRGKRTIYKTIHFQRKRSNPFPNPKAGCPTPLHSYLFNMLLTTQGNEKRCVRKSNYSLSNGLSIAREEHCLVITLVC